jgi:diacylglycerol O-acyltransferase
MRQLEWMDHLFIAMESPRTPGHVGPVLIYDSSTAPNGEVTFEDVTEEIRRRLALVPVFRRRAIGVPMGLDHSYWLEDPDFDLEYHLRHVALPKPGDWRQFCTQVARLHSRALDLTRPPWECTMIEGLDSIEGLPKGSFALAMKIHHAAIDGMAGVQLINVISDQSSDAAPPDVIDRWKPDSFPPTWHLMTRAGVHAFTRPVSAARLAVTNAAPIVRDLPTRLRQRSGRIGSVPRTRFNDKVSPHKVFDAVRFPLAEMKRIKAAVPGATVNDVAIAYVGGGLLRYLEAKGEKPDAALVAVVPISTRVPGQAATEGNQATMMRVSMSTDISDPVKRLAAIHQSTQTSKETQRGVAAETLREVSQAIPGALIGIAMRAAAALPTSGPPMANTLVTNTPGPKDSLYFCGARLHWPTGMTPLFDGMGLAHSVSSYVDDFLCQITACREMLPDPGFYMDCLNDSLAELKKATADGRSQGQ